MSQQSTLLGAPTSDKTDLEPMDDDLETTELEIVNEDIAASGTALKDSAEGSWAGIADRAENLLSGPIRDLKVELIDVEWTGQLLILTVDSLEQTTAVTPAADLAEGPDSSDISDDDSEMVSVSSPSGVTADQLAEISRLASLLLDQHEVISSGYALEVSSPGLERRLRKHDHFRRAVGEKVSIKLNVVAELDRVIGYLSQVDHPDRKLESAADFDMTVMADEVDGAACETAPIVVSFTEIEKAATIFDWGSVATKNKPKGSKRKKRGTKTKNQATDSKAERGNQ